MAYATVAQVQSCIPTTVLTIGAGSAPSMATVTEWIASESAWMDAALRWRYTVPVTHADDLALLLPVCTGLVLARILDFLTVAGGDLQDAARQERAQALSKFVYYPGGLGTWMAGGSAVLLGRDSAAMGRSQLVLPNTALSSSGVAAGRKPSSTLTDPEEEGSNARLFRMGEPL